MEKIDKCSEKHLETHTKLGNKPKKMKKSEK